MNAEPEREDWESAWAIEARLLAEEQARRMAEAAGRADPLAAGIGPAALGGMLAAMLLANFVGAVVVLALVRSIERPSLSLEIFLFCFSAFSGGILLAELGLLSIWSVFGAPVWYIRWPLTLLAGELLLGAVVGGVILTAPRPPAAADLRVVCLFFLFLPTIVLAIQTPLWLFRYFSNFHFVRRRKDGGQDSEIDARPGVQHLLGAMTITAIVLGLARTGFDIAARLQGEDPNMVSLVAWLIMSAYFGFFAVSSAFTLLPGLWAVFLAKRKGRACAIVVAYYLWTPLMLIGVATAIFGGPFHPPPDAVAAVVGGLLLAIGGATAAFLGGLYWIRRRGGYDLVRH